VRAPDQRMNSSGPGHDATVGSPQFFRQRSGRNISSKPVGKDPGEPHQGTDRAFIPFARLPQLGTVSGDVTGGFKVALTARVA
jgi:hypothetical protein